MIKETNLPGPRGKLDENWSHLYPSCPHVRRRKAKISLLENNIPKYKEADTLKLKILFILIYETPQD